MTETPDEKIVERVRKLLALAAKNPNEAEAASATAKAQELLAAYNLDLATVESGGATGGARADILVRGGVYHYQRDLWRAVSKLNFCLHFVTVRHLKTGGLDQDGLPRFRRTHQHQVVGRRVNAAATMVMAQYLEQAVERLTRDRYPANEQAFSRDAVAFREGVSDRVYNKLLARRNDVLAAEEAAEVSASSQGVSTATALTVAKLSISEHDLNWDHVMGAEPGTTAANRAERAAKIVAQAAADAEADRAYAEWAAANPEEARKEEALQRSKRRKEHLRSARRTTPSDRERRARSGAYYAGWETGEGVSIEPQVDKAEVRRIGNV